MNILSDLYTALSALDIPIETGVFKDEAPERYIVIVPMVESFDLHADNAPGVDVQEVRLSLYSQGNYIKGKNALIKMLLGADFTITDRRYIGYETETGYHHYAVDVAKHYEMEE